MGCFIFSAPLNGTENNRTQIFADKRGKNILKEALAENSQRRIGELSWEWSRKGNTAFLSRRNDPASPTFPIFLSKLL